MIDLKIYDGCALLAMCVYGEARNQPIDGQVAVANVVKNRVLNPKWWGNSWKTVLLRHKFIERLNVDRYQFSCFNPDDPNRQKAIEAWANRHTNLGMKQAAWVAKGVICGDLKDNTAGANHYHVARMMPLPSWALGRIPLKAIGEHLFYNLH